MKWKLAILVFTLLVLSAVFMVPSVKAAKTITLNPIADAHVESPEEKSNFGGASWLKVADSDNMFVGKCYAYIMFDLASIPSGVTIESGILQLISPSLTETHKVGAHFCSNNNWKEDEITWKNKPDFSKSPSSTVTVSKADVWYNWTVTEDVKTALSSDDKKLTIVMKSEDRHGTAWVNFYSRDQTYEWMKKYIPKLVISYTEAAAPGGCIIATATYGSELSPEVQFLRGFRDNIVLNTFAGRNFMNVFNAWYYFFSPTVASFISGNELIRGVARVVLYPLIGVLHLSFIAFSLFSFNSELGVAIAGLVASSLIALVYVVPWVLPFSFLRKFKLSAKIIRMIGLVWAGTIIATSLAEVARSSLLMMASTGAFVLVTICLTTLITVKAVTKYVLQSINSSG
jgi:hypothetical protein